MKRTILLACMILLLLGGCSQGQRQLCGPVTELMTDSSGALTGLVVETDGKERGILLTEETLVASQVEGISREDFLAGTYPEVIVSAPYDRLDETLTTADGRELKACAADFLILEEARTGEVALPDGAAAELWQGSFSDRYCLADGTELLSVSAPTGPDGVFVGGLTGFEDLSQAAQERISAYYEAQGLLYDPAVQLERAYQAYRTDPDGFDSFFLEQTIYPTASNDRVIYFCTTLTLPIDGRSSTMRDLCAAFDRETGEFLDPWSLFTLPPEEAAEALLDAAQIPDSADRQEMLAALRPEHLIFHPEHLEVTFPQGTLPGEELTHIVAVDYPDLEGILQPWAVPVSETSTEISASS